VISLEPPVRVCVVVVTHEGLTGRTRRCLSALQAHCDADVVVVDNSDAAALAGSAPYRARYEPFGVEVVVVPNRGFGAAANAGFEIARERGAAWIVLLNDDVTVAAGWLEPLVREFGDSTVGAVQPMLVFAGSGRVNSLGVAVGSDGAGNDIGLGDEVDTVDSSSRDIEIFTGGAVALRPEFLAATGGFDERYFLYYEDVDLARRGARLGWRYRCVPTAVVEHERGASTSALGERVSYLRERNRLWSAFRNEPVQVVVGAIWLSIRRLRHRPYGMHLRALGAGVVGGSFRVVERVRTR
jgi:N-acetylglucosaminyl-diphospho-decaprenol L-rhamnosyltransferase